MPTVRVRRRIGLVGIVILSASALFKLIGALTGHPVGPYHHHYPAPATASLPWPGREASAPAWTFTPDDLFPPSPPASDPANLTPTTTGSR